MRPADYGRLVALAAIWGAAFIFMRVAAPALGAIWTAELRVLLGGAALLAWFRLTGFDPQLKRHARAYLLVGSVNIALPFVLYFRLVADVGATRALTVTFLIPAFGLLWGSIFLGESLPAGTLAGAVLIVAGTALVTRA